MLSNFFSQVKLSLLKNQDTGQTIFKNTFWLTVSEVVGRLLRIAIIIYAARALGAAGWGIFSYLTSFAAVLTIFSDIGLSTVVIKEIANKPNERQAYFSTAFGLKLVLVGASFLFIVVGAPLLTTNIELTGTLALLIGLLFVFDSFRRFGTSLFRADEKMEWEALINILTQLVIVGGGFAALLVAPTPESLGAAYAAGAFVGLLATGFILRSEVKQLLTGFTKRLAAPIMHAAWPLSIAAAFGAFLVNIDTVMIGWFREATSVGFYAAAQRPIAFLYILPSLIIGGFFPALAKLAEKTKEFRRLFEQGMEFIFLAAFPISFGILLTADQIIQLIYGAEYLPAVGSLRILALTILTAFPAGLLMHSALVHNKQRALVPFWTAGLVLNVGLNALLIPTMGIAGAAWASFITQLTINALIWQKMKRIHFFSMKDRLAPILLATLMMTIAIALLRLAGLNLFIVAAGGIAAYFGSLSLSGEHPLRELKDGFQSAR